MTLKMSKENAPTDTAAVGQAADEARKREIKAKKLKKVEKRICSSREINDDIRTRRERQTENSISRRAGVQNVPA